MKITKMFFVCAVAMLLACSYANAAYDSSDKMWHMFTQAEDQQDGNFGIYGNFTDDYVLISSPGALAMFVYMRYPYYYGSVTSQHVGCGTYYALETSYVKTAYFENMDTAGNIERFDYKTVTAKSNFFMLFSGNQITSDFKPFAGQGEQRKFDNYVYAVLVANMSGTPDSITTFARGPIYTASAYNNADCGIAIESINKTSYDYNKYNVKVANIGKYNWATHKTKIIGKGCARSKPSWYYCIRVPLVEARLAGSFISHENSTVPAWPKKISKSDCGSNKNKEITGMSYLYASH